MIYLAAGYADYNRRGLEGRDWPLMEKKLFMEKKLT